MMPILQSNFMPNYLDFKQNFKQFYTQLQTRLSKINLRPCCGETALAALNSSSQLCPWIKRKEQIFTVKIFTKPP